MDHGKELEALLAKLEGTAPGEDSEGDAIAEALTGLVRVTAVRRLRDDEVMQRFRSELAAGRMEAATVKSFLDLLGQTLNVVLTGRGVS